MYHYNVWLHMDKWTTQLSSQILYSSHSFIEGFCHVTTIYRLFKCLLHTKINCDLKPLCPDTDKMVSILDVILIKWLKIVTRIAKFFESRVFFLHSMCFIIP